MKRPRPPRPADSPGPARPDPTAQAFRQIADALDRRERAYLDRLSPAARLRRWGL